MSGLNVGNDMPQMTVDLDIVRGLIGGRREPPSVDPCRHSAAHGRPSCGNTATAARRCAGNPVTARILGGGHDGACDNRSGYYDAVIFDVDSVVTDMVRISPAWNSVATASCLIRRLNPRWPRRAWRTGVFPKDNRGHRFYAALPLRPRLRGRVRLMATSRATPCSMPAASRSTSGAVSWSAVIPKTKLSA
jgi:hypothetical protein